MGRAFCTGCRWRTGIWTRCCEHGAGPKETHSSDPAGWLIRSSSDCTYRSCGHASPMSPCTRRAAWTVHLPSIGSHGQAKQAGACLQCPLHLLILWLSVRHLVVQLAQLQGAELAVPEPAHVCMQPCEGSLAVCSAPWHGAQLLRVCDAV